MGFRAGRPFAVGYPCSRSHAGTKVCAWMPAFIYMLNIAKRTCFGHARARQWGRTAVDERENQGETIFERIFCRDSRAKTRGRDQNQSIDSNLVVYHPPLALTMSAHPKFSQVFSIALALLYCVSTLSCCFCARALSILAARGAFLFQKFEFSEISFRHPPALPRRLLAPPGHFRRLIALFHSL